MKKIRFTKSQRATLSVSLGDVVVVDENAEPALVGKARRADVASMNAEGAGKLYNPANVVPIKLARVARPESDPEHESPEGAAVRAGFSAGWRAWVGFGDDSDESIEAQFESVELNAGCQRGMLAGPCHRLYVAAYRAAYAMAAHANDHAGGCRPMVCECGDYFSDWSGVH